MKHYVSYCLSLEIRKTELIYDVFFYSDWRQICTQQIFLYSSYSIFMKIIAVLLYLSYKICTIKTSHVKTVFIISACWQTPLCFSSSLRSVLLHFWAEFWPGPAAERRRLGTTAEICLFLRPEKEHPAISCWNSDKSPSFYLKGISVCD